jgi:hypothetical protein
MTGVPIDPASDHSTYAKIEDLLRGQIDVDVPDSGLSGVEIYGYNGSCDVVRDQDYDLIFHGGAEYEGGDSVVVPVLPNLSCSTEQLTVRPINILKLSATRDCAQAAVATGKMASTTLTKLLFLDELYWWGGLSTADLVAGVSTFQGRAKVGSGMLTLLHTVAGEWSSLSCRPPAGQQVCATGTEIEAATIPLAVARASQDPTKYADVGGVAFGLVYGTAGPIAGATVTLPASQVELAQIVYLDLPAGVENGTGALVARPGTTTGPSGLFAIYTASMLDITIAANGTSVQRKLGTATDEDKPTPPVAMIVKL